MNLVAVFRLRLVNYNIADLIAVLVSYGSGITLHTFLIHSGEFQSDDIFLVIQALNVIGVVIRTAQVYPTAVA